jgi:hypothetical protein
MTSYEIDSDLSERQIEADVASYLGHVSRFFGEFRLLDVDEQEPMWADKSLTWEGVAYFFQFKKPVGLKPATGPIAAEKDERQRQGIRRFRSENDLDQVPYSVCFELRRSPSNAPLQHNVLFNYERPPTSRAVYVCPLVLDDAMYRLLLQQDIGSLSAPFVEWRSQYGRDALSLARAAELSPFLRGHASIVPHDHVETWEHHYSFSRQATDIAFHDTQVLEGSARRLSDFVAEEIRRRAGNKEPLSSPLTLARCLSECAEETIRDDLGEPARDNAIDWLVQHGRLLSDRFAIRQMILLRRVVDKSRQSSGAPSRASLKS